MPTPWCRTSNRALRERSQIGRSTLTASRNTALRSGRWLRQSLREACTLSPGGTRLRSAPTSAHRFRTAPEVLLKRWFRMAPEPHLGCWAICSGRQSVKVRGQYARHHRTRAKAERGWEPQLITLHSRCRRFGKTKSLSSIERDHLALLSALSQATPVRRVFGGRVWR